MDQQRLYWQEVVTLRRDARYVDLCLARTEVVDRCIKAALAIIASSSIGGWVVFKEYAFIWAAIVAGSQVLQVVKEFLPYKTRLKALSQLSQDLNALSLSAENQWFRVAQGDMFDDDIHDVRFDLKKRKMAVVQKSFPTAGMPEIKKLADRAERETQEYLSTYLEEEA